MFKKLGKHRLTFSYVMALLVIVFAHKPLFLPALILVLIGSALRFWAAGHVVKSHKLTQDGPYSHTRNPLYLGSFIAALGTFLLIHNWWLMVVFLAGFWLFYGATIKSEEGFLRGKFGEDFINYTRNVPAFFPRLTSYKTPDKSGFSWKMALSNNHEYISFLCTVAVVAMIFIVAYLRH